MEIGQKLKDARAKTALTQEAVAEKIGVSRQSVSNWENNRSYPDIASVLKLSDLYCVSLDELLKEDEHMKQHIEDNANWLKKYCNLLCDGGFLLAVLSNLFLQRSWTTAAIVSAAIALLVAILPRIVYVKTFGSSGKLLAAHCIVWSMWIIGNTGSLWMPDSLIPSLVCTAGFWGILIVRYREYQCGERRHAPWFLFILLIVLELISLIAFSAQMLYSVGDLHEVNPFPCIYIVDEVLFSSDNGQVPIRVQLDINDGLNLMDASGEYTKIGTFSYAALTEGEQAEGLLGLWRLVPETSPEELYKLTVEADSCVVLCHYVRDSLQEKYRLSRIDTLFVSVTTLGSNMTTQPNWYIPGEWADTGPSPHTYTVAGKADVSVGFYAEPVDDLVMYEEYHNGDQVEFNTYHIQPDKKGRLKLKLFTRYQGEDPYTSSGQYAVYRIPYKGGEYIFTLRFD